MVKGYIDKNREYFQSKEQYKSNQREGDVTIKYNKKGNKSFEGKGEYIDFEEVD